MDEKCAIKDRFACPCNVRWTRLHLLRSSWNRFSAERQHLPYGCADRRRIIGAGPLRCCWMCVLFGPCRTGCLWAASPLCLTLTPPIAIFSGSVLPIFARDDTAPLIAHASGSHALFAPLSQQTDSPLCVSARIFMGVWWGCGREHSFGRVLRRGVSRAQTLWECWLSWFPLCQCGCIRFWWPDQAETVLASPRALPHLILKQALLLTTPRSWSYLRASRLLKIGKRTF